MTVGNPRPRPSQFTPSLWKLRPDTALSYRPVLADPAARALADAAVASGDAAALLMTLADLIETGHHDAAGVVARAALEVNQHDLPGISSVRLAKIVMGGMVHAATILTADLNEVAAQLRSATTFVDIAYWATTSRSSGQSLQASIERAMTQVSALADRLDKAAAGNWTQATKIIKGLSACGLVGLARSLADAATHYTGCSGLSVTVAASQRHRLGPGRGLAALREILAVEPLNKAAHTSACGCLVDLLQLGEALDHLAVALLDPDGYSANAAIRTLKVARHWEGLRLARRLRDVCNGYASAGPGGPTVIAGDLIATIGRRTTAELALARYRSVAQARFTFDRRVAYDTGRAPLQLGVTS